MTQDEGVSEEEGLRLYLEDVMDERKILIHILVSIGII
jgi:hypothetical protein